MSASKSWGNRLYRGEVSYDFIGKQKRWYTISGVLLLVSVLSLLVFGLKFSLEFRGGSQFRVKSDTASVETIRSHVAATSKAPTVQSETVLGHRYVVVKTTPLTPDQQTSVRNVIAKDAGVQPNDVSPTLISGSWGHEITQKAITGLIIFVALVLLYLAIFYEWKMALSGIIALVHDLVITAGIYALVGFEVSPATVIGFLTILGYSLYDTVVVFDKVRENTKGLGSTKTDQTFTQAANLAVNQTLIRSLNTSLIALIPVASLLFAGIDLHRHAAAGRPEGARAGDARAPAQVRRGAGQGRGAGRADRAGPGAGARGLRGPGRHPGRPARRRRDRPVRAGRAARAAQPAGARRPRAEPAQREAALRR
ncbi:MAG: protein-export membrane protein SecF [Catenulispora sp. 13_1_20CM_3_70_7]|nr:MAG: protein-export membrane protein SecF [Catenulispora sp. 13_1_20CM_3_70_7]